MSVNIAGTSSRRITVHVPLRTRQRRPTRRAVSHAASSGRGRYAALQRENRVASATSRVVVVASRSVARLGRAAGDGAATTAATGGAGGITATAALLGAVTTAGSRRCAHQLRT